MSFCELFNSFFFEIFWVVAVVVAGGGGCIGERYMYNWNSKSGSCIRNLRLNSAKS
ncbi:hypothetical protein CC86DRAFT_28019 [Ophiobolus disseminans]|uniref:Uncharacterized protein n=1 Tax=Ophiobolus disseminans TaxID=1469910 RepID=A0A6A6ZZ33_9PLEO|nr:hypothetical protein CC86DRAFT_28019 [Ophiobolus disseminans]